MSRWAAIVLNWNGGTDTERCLDALGAFDAVVVADNGSTDGSLAALRARTDITLVENGANLGFSGGNNAAIRATDADWVVLVNNDAVLEPGAVDALRAAAARWPDAGILAGRLLHPDGSVQWAGQRLDLRTGYSGRPHLDGAEGPTPRAVGAFMAVSRAALDAAGLLDEALFAYVEDVDWSLRIRRAGFACVLVPAAAARHALSASTGGSASTHTVYYGTRNTIVVCERWRPLGPAATRLRRASILASFSAYAGLVLRRADALHAVRAGYSDARAGRLGERPRKARKRP